MPANPITRSHRPKPPTTWGASLPVFVLALVVISWLAWQLSASPGPVALAESPATVTPTLAPGTGAIEGLAWQDLNGNGTLENGEPPLPGVLLTVYNQDGQVALTMTTAGDGSYRFATLAAGYYRLVATAPAGFQWTTPSQYDLFVSAGWVLTLNFGARFVPTPTPTATPEPRLDIENADTLVCGGLIQAVTLSGNNHVSHYGCRPYWDESGPELVYRVESGHSQLLTATLVTTTVDLDLFLLPSSDPGTCLAAGDNFLTYNIQPGVYFLAVDGYQGAAGSFALHLTCPLEPQATPTPTPTPSPTPIATSTPTPSPTPSPTATRPPSFSYLPLMLQALPGIIPEPVTLTLQQGVNGYTAATDTTLNGWYPDRYYGSESALYLFYSKPPGVTTTMAPLLRFDLTLLPAEAHVVQAELKLCQVVSASHDLRAEVHELLRLWDEQTATWLQPTAGQTWAEPGAQKVGTDHAGLIIDTQHIVAEKQCYTFDITPLAQAWVSDPGRNHGLILLAQPGDDQANVQATFASNEYADPTFRPQLAVSYWIVPTMAKLSSSAQLYLDIVNPDVVKYSNNKEIWE